PNPCLVGSTLVLTDKGNLPIDSLVGKEVNVWNGEEFSKVVPEITGHNQDIIEVSLSDGTMISCTPYHGFMIDKIGKVEAKDLNIGDKLKKWHLPVIDGNEVLVNAYTQGFYSGDGSTSTQRNRQSVYLYNEKEKLIKHLNYKHSWNCDGRIALDVTGEVNKDKSFVPFTPYSVRSRLDWLAGLIDSDGSVNDKGGSITITSINREFLLDVKLMLTTLGSFSTLSLMYDEGMNNMPDGKGSTKKYFCQKCYRLTISATNVKKLMDIGLNTHRVPLIANPNRDASRFIQVVGLINREEKEENVYCFNEPKNHTGTFNGIMTANCGEQPLPDFGCCCLGALNLSAFVNEPFTENATFDFDAFTKSIHIAVR
ncbi:MAG TPA: LAGLIDADG family homing endonuclease, partial [Tissierellaceae bacterium]|nr:LAGLIDADG family homing endonuclease [Tissierellaceae bacterium]